MRVQIFSPAKSAMQSGKGHLGKWVIKFPETNRQTIDPLMGYGNQQNMMQMTHLKFNDKEAAISYAKRCKLAFEVVEASPPKIREVAYADNFSYRRRDAWTH